MNTFSTISEMSRILLRRQIWGPFLTIVGAYILFVFVPRQADRVPALMDMIRAGLAVALVLAGIFMMFHQLRSDERVALPMSQPADQSSGQPEYTVAQLSKNYELLRRQTTQGFILSGVFMALGLLVILSGSAGKLFGFASQGGNLATVAGLLMEFISGTSLLVYRINFNRLNETTDKLDGAWRILTAHRLAQSPPEERRAEATLRLVDALLKSPTSGPPPNRAVGVDGGHEGPR